jgi:hypothetical protein
MTDHATATPKHLRDPALAEAFWKLEGAIGDLHQMAAVMEIVIEGTIGRREAEDQKRKRDRLQLPEGFTVYALSVEQDDALHYALLQIARHIRQLHAEYHAGFERAGIAS